MSKNTKSSNQALKRLMEQDKFNSEEQYENPDLKTIAERVLSPLSFQEQTPHQETKKTITTNKALEKFKAKEVKFSSEEEFKLTSSKCPFGISRPKSPGVEKTQEIDKQINNNSEGKEFGMGKFFRPVATGGKTSPLGMPMSISDDSLNAMASDSKSPTQQR